MKRCVFAVVAFLLAGVPSLRSQGANAPHYTIENLGSFGGQIPTITGINSSGQMSGVVNGSQAVRYTPGIGWEDFPVLGGFSVANGINASGDIVGYRFAPAGLRAFRYRDGAGVEDIDPLPGGTMTFGFAINAAGDVAGYGDAAGGAFLAFRANPSLPAVTLPNLGGAFALACGINDAGQIAGAATTAGGVQHAVRIDPGQPTPVEIASFDGAAGTSTACAIDADGRVGGQADQAATPRAFRFFGGSLLPLDTFASTMSSTESIAGGTSVGWYVSASDDSPRAFVHTDAHGSLDLNTLVDEGSEWVLSLAKGVNASGVIVGEGTFKGAPALFRLTPADEPPSDTTPPVITSVRATPSRIWPPDGRLVPVSIAVSATDNVDSAPVCALTDITATDAAADDAAFTGPLTAYVRAVGGRTYTLIVRCSDAAGNSSDGSAEVVVPPDTTAPVISALVANPSTIWPPNNQFVAVSLRIVATDDVDASPRCALTSITGGSAGDARLTGERTASLRAEKGNVYELFVTCSDRAGNSSEAVTSVSVTNKPSVGGLFRIVRILRAHQLHRGHNFHWHRRR